MFALIDKFLDGLFGDIQSTFTTLFSIAILITALGTFFGGEEAAPKFKKGLWFSVACLIIFLLAGLITTYVDGYF